MGPSEVALDRSKLAVVPLCDAYRALNDQRVEIDRRIMVLPPNDPSRDTLWREVELVLAQLRDVVGHLAKIRATQLTELRAKAETLATLLQPSDADGPVIPENERVALVLSLTDDITRLPG